MNVLLTRAKFALRIVGNSENLAQANSMWAQLKDHAVARNSLYYFSHFNVTAHAEPIENHLYEPAPILIESAAENVNYFEHETQGIENEEMKQTEVSVDLEEESQQTTPTESEEYVQSFETSDSEQEILQLQAGKLLEGSPQVQTIALRNTH